jgi:GTP-binding protein
MIDTVRINVKAGNGGDGCISFLRLKYQPRGGPDGGDGGDGGSAYIVGDDSINTLLHLKFNSTFYLERGTHGKGKNQRGGNGKDRHIPVPMGTVVWRMNRDGSKDFLADITADQPVLIAQGGQGGWGNARFVSSTNQEPMLSESGKRGDYSVLWLELKLLADVGLLAKPNAGKSTLISRCSAAKPKVADYPFTTVEPVLGVVTHGGQDFVMMEIPGLLEGAHRGIGLGHQFLRHAERARVYVHLIDGMSDDPAGDYLMLNRELHEFSPMLAAKPQVVAVSKLDTTETYELRDVIEEELRRVMVEAEGFDPGEDATPLHFISSVSGAGIDGLLGELVRILSDVPRTGLDESEWDDDELVNAAATVGSEERRPLGFYLDGDVYVVESERLERLTGRADMRDYRVLLQLWREMTRLGIARRLEEAGIEAGDTIRIGNAELEWF